jgi:hypothetical protein
MTLIFTYLLLTILSLPTHQAHQPRRLVLRPVKVRR